MSGSDHALYVGLFEGDFCHWFTLSGLDVNGDSLGSDDPPFRIEIELLDVSVVDFLKADFFRLTVGFGSDFSLSLEDHLPMFKIGDRGLLGEEAEGVYDADPEVFVVTKGVCDLRVCLENMAVLSSRIKKRILFLLAHVAWRCYC